MIVVSPVLCFSQNSESTELSLTMLQACSQAIDLKVDRHFGEGQAVSIETLVEFVTKVQPFLAQRIFPATKQTPPVSADIYPKFVPPRSDGLFQHRPEEPDEVRLLRQQAQLLADNIRNVIAVQSFAWGSGDKDPYGEATYEVRVIDGVQRFRSNPDGKKELEDVPFQFRTNGWVVPANEWSQLPKMVGTDFRLKVHQVPDLVMNERRVKVFQYYFRVAGNQGVDRFGQHQRVCRGLPHGEDLPVRSRAGRRYFHARSRAK
jgi:hypothetical protein